MCIAKEGPSHRGTYMIMILLKKLGRWAGGQVGRWAGGQVGSPGSPGSPGSCSAGQLGSRADGLRGKLGS